LYSQYGIFACGEAKVIEDKAKPRVNSWLPLRFCQAKAKYRSNYPPKAMAFGF
jgi:hypothetical protein